MIVVGLVVASIVTTLIVTNNLARSEKTSAAYLGKWYVINADNERLLVNITKDAVTVNERKYTLKEFDSGIQNNMEYYKIRIDDTDFAIVYRDKDNKSEAQLLLLANSKEIKGMKEFAMSRDDYPKKFK